MTDIKKLESILEKYTYHAGDWHDSNCSFPTVDHAVCNCKIHKNRGEVAQFLADN